MNVYYMYDRWTAKYVEGLGRNIILSHYSGICLEGLKPQSGQVKIWTRDLPNKYEF
jgi:hypothetical protein